MEQRSCINVKFHIATIVFPRLLKPLSENDSIVDCWPHSIQHVAYELWVVDMKTLFLEPSLYIWPSNLRHMTALGDMPSHETKPSGAKRTFAQVGLQPRSIDAGQLFEHPRVAEEYSKTTTFTCSGQTVVSSTSISAPSMSILTVWTSGLAANNCLTVVHGTSTVSNSGWQLF